jgi:hypothetical protein
MHTAVRPLCFRIFSAVIAEILTFSGASWAQTQDQSAPTEKASPSSAPQKPVHKPHTVIINDPIVRLATPSSRPAAGPAAPAPEAAAAKESPATAEDATQKKAEIAALEKQIKEKQQKVELLMRLFVADEQAFLKNPVSLSEDPVTRERLRYEQDELHWETAEVARLRAQLNALKSATER